MKVDSIISNWLKKNRELKKKCLHDTCRSCNGKGIKENGSECFHFISCPCSKCSPSYF